MSGDGRAALAGDDILRFLKPLVPVSELDAAELPVVRLEPGRVEALAELGAMRARDGRGTIPNHERGALGEYAVSKHLGVTGEFDTEIYEGGDPGFDLRYRGMRVDVKTVGPRVNSPRLHVSTHGELTADYYILVQQLNRREYRVFGCAPRPVVRRSSTFRFSRSRRLWPDRYGDEVYVVEQDRLSPIARLG
ncbi:hypothetical protein [Salinigranum halophilum]|uniref:hypothetical protein n=1 Tax=Salinigranum halophilum TaxID=2565931 RepID=UPI00115E65E4|nr:hypothetical protein [Salinigranum halophilum]